MKQLVILSGKGGTGKTSVTAALAHLAAQDLSLVLVDADVDASNLELVLNPNRLSKADFMGGQLAIIDPDTCTSCGICAEVCRFDAIAGVDGVYDVDGVACEGCAACYTQCPSDAIRMETQHAGEWYRSDTRFGPLFHAHLYAGQENSGKLVTLVKQQGRLLASDEDRDLILIDGPPGIGCPVIAASAGADLALQVVEPTVSGVHDLERALATTRHFGIPSLVCLNKADINEAQADRVRTYCQDEGIPLVGAIPYDTVVTEAMVHGSPVTAYRKGPVADALRDLWERTKEQLHEY
jgi:MinD superfamily P-loop ATPase